MTSLPHASPAALRRELRARRRAVPPDARRRAERRLAVFADGLRLLRPGRRLALYLPLPEEIGTAELMRRARARRCHIYLPRITDARRSRMAFVDANAPLVRGRWGVLEPSSTARISTRSLDVIFMPLVGVDHRGNRLGMGKGFYDRALAFRRHLPRTGRPVLVGLAFACQQVDLLSARPHDVPLDFLITEKGVHRFRNEGAIA